MIIRNKFNGYSGDGRRLYPGGGGGSQPTNTTQTTTTIPQYARPTVERMIGRAEALSKEGYKPYGGERVAEFTPLQQQSFDAAGRLGPAGQIGQGTQFAGIAGAQGLGAGQQYAQQATSPGAMNAYMSPYTQLALEPQMREAARRSAMEGQAQQAMAAQRGAFGGSRTAIAEAERQRNLGQLQSDIYGRGMQTAFEQAQRAQQFGADLGLRGAGLGLQAAGQLGQLGQQQFGQEEASMRAKGAAGAQQQARQQQILSQDYQDFLDEKNYEKQQLSFLSDILRGVPLSQSSYQTYQSPASFASQAAQLGAGAYGFSQLGKGGFFNEGGEVKRYAEGGIADAAPQPQGSVPNTMDIDRLRAALDGMSEEQLEAVKENTKDATTFALAQEQQTLNARMRNAGILAESIPETTIKDEMIAADSGIAAAPIPPSMFGNTAVGEREEAPEAMARGGIVAFAKGAQVQAQPDYVSKLAAMDPSAAFATPEARIQASEEGFKRYKEFMGPDEVETATKDLMKGLELTPENKAMQRAGLAFAIASKFGRRGKTFEEELGEAGGVIAEKSAEVEKLDREIKRQQALMNLDLKKTQRAEKKGQWDMMEKYGDKADTRAERLYGLEAAKANTMADIQLKKDKMAQDERLGMAQIAATRAGQTDFNRQVLANKIDEAVAQFTASKGRAPNPQELAQIKGSASEAAAKILKPADPFGAPKLNVAVENAVSTRMGKDKVYNDLALALLTADPKDKPAIQARMDARESQIRSEVQTNAGAAPGAGVGGTGKPSLQEFLAKARAANPKVSDADLTAYYNKTYGQ
jgi:hypothetical protein